MDGDAFGRRTASLKPARHGGKSRQAKELRRAELAAADVCVHAERDASLAWHAPDLVRPGGGPLAVHFGDAPSAVAASAAVMSMTIKPGSVTLVHGRRDHDPCG